MITFELACHEGHRFEGWFANREMFERQRAESQIECPLCGSHQIEKLLSPVAVHTSKSQPVKRESNQPAAAPAAQAVGGAPLQTTLRQIANFVESHFEDVGEKFTEEAIKIHKGEVEERPIRGTSTPEEDETLEELGVTYFKMPLPKYDA